MHGAGSTRSGSRDPTRSGSRGRSAGLTQPGSLARHDAARFVLFLPMICGVFNRQRTAWHITVGTYMSRLHGGDRPTVDRRRNQRGEPFVGKDADREQRERDRARGEPVRLTREQREMIERVLPCICERGGWTFHVCAAPHPDDDHFHILLDADPAVDGKEIRKWLKRWLTEKLDEAFGRPAGGNSGGWWVDGGSTKPVKNAAYFARAFNYILKQRSTAFHRGAIE